MRAWSADHPCPLNAGRRGRRGETKTVSVCVRRAACSGYGRWNLQHAEHTEGNTAGTEMSIDVHDEVNGRFVSKRA